MLEGLLERFLSQLDFGRRGHHQRRDVWILLRTAEWDLAGDFGQIDQLFKLGGVGRNAEHVGNFL